MNRILIVLLSGVLTAAWSGGAAAEGQESASAMTKLMVLFSFRASHITVPQSVVAPGKDWAIVKYAKSEQAERAANEKQLGEARQRIAERERELGLARKAFRNETSRIAHGVQPAAGDDPLEAAARRVSQREQEAYQAKLEYGRVARAVREQRRQVAVNTKQDS